VIGATMASKRSIVAALAAASMGQDLSPNFTLLGTRKPPSVALLKVHQCNAFIANVFDPLRHACHTTVSLCQRSVSLRQRKPRDTLPHRAGPKLRHIGHDHGDPHLGGLCRAICPHLPLLGIVKVAHCDGSYHHLPKNRDEHLLDSTRHACHTKTINERFLINLSWQPLPKWHIRQTRRSDLLSTSMNEVVRMTYAKMVARALRI
jgi:hypothetical protein